MSAAFGVQVPPAEYWQRLREIADKYNVVLIADEVITAFGRLGEWFGPTNWGVQPDITAVAKAITSGYAPLGAAIATKKIADAFIGGPNETFKHLITFGGHPIASAAALANLKIFEREDLVGNSRRMGTYLYEQLQTLYDHRIVGDVRGGLGLLAAVELVSDRESKSPFPAEAGLAAKLPKMLFDRNIVTFRASKLRRQPGGKSPGWFVFERPDEGFRMLHELATAESTRGMLASQAENNELLGTLHRALEDNPLPPFSVLRKYLAPTGSILTNNETGFHYTGFGLRRK